MKYIIKVVWVGGHILYVTNIKDGVVYFNKEKKYAERYDKKMDAVWVRDLDVSPIVDYCTVEEVNE